MANTRRDPGDKTRRDMAMYLAMAVRNAMEDFHHKHLTDEQMRELNPIIRNAIYTALTASRKAYEGDAGAEFYLEHHQKMIPEYWEQPVLDDTLAKIPGTK